jgi:hypothetical protein
MSVFDAPYWRIKGAQKHLIDAGRFERRYYVWLQHRSLLPGYV